MSATLAVLAGGAGSRMGLAKSLLTIQGQPIVARLHDRLRWRGPTLLITSPGREKPPGSELFDREVIDAVADQGPLRGIAMALEYSTTDLILIIPVDMPCLNREPLEALAGHLSENAESIGFYFQSDSDRPRVLPVALRASALKSAQLSIDRGVLSLRRWYEAVGVTAFAPGRELPSRFWENLNYPDDLSTVSS